MAGVWPTSFDDFDSAPVQSRKRKHPSGSSNAGKIQSSQETKTLVWVDKYTPSSFDDLAVHKKKVAEVEAWVSHSKVASEKTAPILLMTGPSGCGKTATMAVVGAAHDMEIQEWTNPISLTFAASREAGLRHVTLTTQFEEFLFRGGRYPSLSFVGDSPKPDNANPKEGKILLIEDLPHHILREPTGFRDVLRQYRLHQKNPLVIILSDGSVPDSVKRNLLPADVISQLGIHNISFNPIATTSMNKVLMKIATKENRRVTKEVLNSVVSTASGDVRAAINTLQFLLQKGSAVTLLPSEPKKSRGKSIKRRKSVDLSTDNVMPSIGGKDVSLLLFRALGKILYCKRKEPEQRVPPLPIHLQHCYRDPLVFEPENILEHCCLSGASYSLFLHHNCVPFFSKLDDLSSALDYLCIADIASTRKSGVDFSTDSTNVLDAYEGSMSARCVAFCNSDRATLKQCEEATGKWRPLHKPSWYQVSKKRSENETSSHQLFWHLNMPSQEMLLNLLPYLHKMNSLMNNNVFKPKAGMHPPLDKSQRDFLMNVVHLPKWKSFASANERIVESELGEDFQENMQNLTAFSDLAVDGENIDSAQQDPEEDFNIEEYSD